MVRFLKQKPVAEHVRQSMARKRASSLSLFGHLHR